MDCLRPPSIRRGVALILVVGVLALLATLSVSFVVLSRLERRASQQRLLASKASLLCRSGLEDALARISMGQDPEAGPNRYGGEDWEGNASLNVWRCPVRHALRPSFSARDVNPVLTPIDGRLRGHSGRLTDDSGYLGNQYALRVDRAGGFFLNGGDPASPSDPMLTSDANTDLRRMLGILAEAVGRLEGPSSLTEPDGWNLVDRRPATGWQDWEQVRDQALEGSREKIHALRGYLVLSSWVDRKVIRPTATERMLGKVRSWTEIKLGQTGGKGTPRLPPRFEEIGGRIVGRAPLDFGWARTRMPALIALLAGVSGIYLDNQRATSYGQGEWIGELRKAELPLDWSQPTDPCRIVAGQILACTSDLSDWDAFKTFCNTLKTTETARMSRLGEQGAGLIQARRDLLLANFNPNSGLNKFNPNLQGQKRIDKMDLLQQSTELSLVPVCTHEVTSIGRVLGPGGRLLASRTLRGTLPSPSVLRLTTQGEFVCEDLGDLDIAGDEGLTRTAGSPVEGVREGLRRILTSTFSPRLCPDPRTMAWEGTGIWRHSRTTSGRRTRTTPGKS